MRDNWTETTLGDIAEVVGGGTPATSNPSYWDGDIVWLTPTEVVAAPGSVLIDSARKITESGLKNSGARLLPEGTVILTSRASVGFSALAGTALATNQGFQSLIPSAQINNKFLMFWIQNNQQEFISRAAGSTFKEISKANVRSIALALPPLSEQKRIVDVMGSIDTYITALRQQADDARTARNAVLHELLTSGGDDWTQTTLGEVAEIQQGQNLAISTLTTGDYPVYGANGIVGHFDRWNFDQEVVALGCRGSCGTVHIVTEKAWLANNVMAIWPKDVSQIVVSFIALVLETADLRSSGVISGQVQPQITRTSLSPLVINVPSLSDQEEIVEIVSAMDDVIRSTEQTIGEAQMLRSGLLSDLLSGEHEIPESYDRLLGAA